MKKIALLVTALMFCLNILQATPINQATALTAAQKFAAELSAKTAAMLIVCAIVEHAPY